MNRKDLSPVLSAGFLSFLLAFGGIRCLTTAFEIQISLTALTLHSILWSFAAAYLFARPKGGWIMAGILALAAVYLWRRSQLVDQLLQLCYRISRPIGTAYGLGWLGKPTGVSSVALPLYLWAGLIGLIAAWCLTRRRASAVAIVFSLLPLALCLILTDTIPTVSSLATLLLGLILVLLTQGVRRRNAAQAASLTWMLSIPVALALLLLFVTNPQATYNKQQYADRMGNALLRAVDRIPFVDFRADGSLHFSLTRHIPDFVDLQYKGANNQFPIPVMEVTADSSGILYLRGRDYDTYAGSAWYASTSRDEPFTSIEDNYNHSNVLLGELTIKTSGGLSSRYLPYYPDTRYLLQGGACDNLGNASVYSYNWYALPEPYYTPAHNWKDPDSWLYSRATYAGYLQLPEDTKTWAESYLDAHMIPASEGTTVNDVANAIADLVRASAIYDLDTDRMPEETGDFARWFLEESDTGYCVHFASATTVLLRAAGIPARYVEGYLAETQAGEPVTVTERDAHAWAEYYVSGIGWIPLESTAANLSSGPAPLRPTEQTTAPIEESSTALAITEAPTTTEAPTEQTTPPSEHTPEPTDTTPGKPGNNTDPSQPSKPVPLKPGEEKDFTLGTPLLITAAVIIALLGQYPLRLRMRERQLQTGSPNSRAIKHWRISRRLAKLTRQPLPEDLHELALRAKFSQHKLTDDDLIPFAEFRTQTLEQLRNRPWWQRIFHRLFWAAY